MYILYGISADTFISKANSEGRYLRMTDSYVPLGFTDSNVHCGSHIACVYQTDVEKVGIALDFIAAGIRNNEKCIAAILETSSDLWINGLRSRGINPGKLNCRQLEIINAGSITAGCKASGIIDTVPHSIVSSIESSLHDNWNGIRLCAGFDSFLHDEHIAVSHLAAEHGIDEIIKNNPVTALCLFGSNMLHMGISDHGEVFIDHRQHPV